MLADAGIQVILDHHALPGVQTADQTFTGKYVSASESISVMNDPSWPTAAQTPLCSM